MLARVQKFGTNARLNLDQVLIPTSVFLAKPQLQCKFILNRGVLLSNIHSVFSPFLH